MKILAFDTETHLIQPGNLTPKLVCVSFADEKSSHLVDAQQGLDALEESLKDGYSLVGHNVAFDLAVVTNARRSLLPLVFAAYADNRIYDTKVREELNDISIGRVVTGSKHMVNVRGQWQLCDYSLAGLARRYLQKDRSAQKEQPDAWRFRYAELDGVPINTWPEEARRYALEDAEDTYKIFKAQQTPHDEFTHTRAAWALHLMSAQGIRTDAAAVHKLEAELLEEQKRNRRRLVKAGILKAKRMTPKELRDGKVPDFVEDNKNMRWAKDTKRIKEYVQRVYARKGLKPPLTETGEVSTDKDTLNESGSLLLSLLSDSGGVDKILQTYVPVLKHGIQAPINARFNVLVNSGRTSCLAGNSLIRTSEGYVPLMEIKAGMLVWTHKNRWKQVTAFIQQGVREVVKLSLSNGKTLTCTRDHRFLTSAGKWLSVEEICCEYFKKLDFQQTESGSNGSSIPKQRFENNCDDCEDSKHDNTKRHWGFAFGNVQRGIQSLKACALSLVQNSGEKSNVAKDARTTPQLEGRLRRWLRLFNQSRQRRSTTLRSSDNYGGSSWFAEFARTFVRSSYRWKSKKQRIGQPSLGDERWAFENTFFTKAGQPFVTVEEIHISGSCEVFDISVEEDESFEVAGVFAHNCSSPNLQNLPTGRRVSGVRECFIPRRQVEEVVEVPDDYVLQVGEEWV